ncbi:MAG TPA: hypothetical protein VGR35_07600 [Tepidisphaeraceae bacterium]|nr:hypothetical protein [Tepidisphaeraceae bacterium]
MALSNVEGRGRSRWERRARRSGWRAQVGNYPILLGVDDGAVDGSGQAQQGCILSVTDSPLNRPPQFSSDPIVEARIGSDYAYQATATDLDHDNLEFSILDAAPAGLGITSGGLLTWEKASLAVGDYPITLKVIDRNPVDGVARGTHDLQPFTIRVLPVAGNHPPEIISDPVITFRPAEPGGARQKVLEGRVRDFKFVAEADVVTVFK